MPVFSPEEEEEPAAHWSDIAFVNKSRLSSLFWLMVSMREAIGGGTVRAKVTFVPGWVPIEGI